VRARRAIACLATIAVADYVILRHPPRWHAIALFDHPAHVATAILIGGPGRGTDPVYLAGSLLPDVDHIPMALGSPSPGDPRPKTHSIVGPLAVAPFSRRLAGGMLAHLARDLGMKPGVPLFAPVSDRAVRIPYALYAGALIAAAVWCAGPGSAARSAATSAPTTGSA
jgi:LexA-binding, inner membrane-associated putative hydrolase